MAEGSRGQDLLSGDTASHLIPSSKPAQEESGFRAVFPNDQRYLSVPRSLKGERKEPPDMAP